MDNESAIRKAAAVKYDPKQDTAPRVVAVGRGELADRITKLAQEHDIFLYKDKELVEQLLDLEVDTQIPPELYQVVAEILAFIYRLDQPS